MSEEKTIRPEKQAIVDAYREKLEESLFVILTDFVGMNVVQKNDFGDRLRASGASFQVVKNRLVPYAAQGLAFEGLEKEQEGPTAMITGKGDVVETAKILKAFIKENDLPVIKMGAMHGVFMSQADVEHLATLPGLTELRGTVVGTIAAPMTQLVGVMNQKVCSLLYVLKAIEEKKQTA